MGEHQIRLHKRSGGATLTGPDGTSYSWAGDNAAVEVPYGWAMELLAIPDGGFYVQGDPVLTPARSAERGTTQSAASAGLAASVEGATPPEHEPEAEADSGPEPEADEDDGGGVSEPAPEAAAAITEPAPPTPPRQDARPITPKRRAGTTTRKG